MHKLYDVFVDWSGRLAREMPGILEHLNAAGARRVLDLGCGTGRHVSALREAGFEADGADASPDMLARAAALLGSSSGLHVWRMGTAPPASLSERPLFDAVLAMGNVWPHVVSEEEAVRTVQQLRKLVRPGGLVLMGLKAVAARRDGNPYLPLLKREHEGAPLWFIRFCDFAVALGPDGVERCEFHMVIVAGESSAARGTLMHHSTHEWRVWNAEELAAWLEAQGLEDVRVGGTLARPDEPPQGEDVFVHAFLPR